MRRLDLRTGTPVWDAYEPKKVPEHSLTRDIKTDVLVVGMGISGAMAADLLSDHGLDVALIDRRGASQGSTPATTALVQFEIDVPLTELVRKVGDDKAIRGWRRSRLAVGNLRDRIVALGIECHLTMRDTLYLAGTRLSGSKLRKEAEARSAAGLWSRYLTASELKSSFGIERAGAILSRGNLVVDPVKLTVGLLESARRRGARLYSPEEAIDIEHGRDGVRVLTRSGRQIKAGHVVLATGYELLEIARDDRHRIISTWAIATRRNAKSTLWPGEAMMWEASDPYLYLRTTHDGRVICGGEDEEFQDEQARDAMLPVKTKRIAAKLKRLLPKLDVTPDFAWAGSFGTTSTGLPLIGPLPQRPRIIAVMGYGGNGLTFSRIAAEIICSHIAGISDSDLDVFAL